MSKIKIIIGIVILWLVFIMIKLPGEYQFIKSVKTQGTICSEQYIKRVRHFASKNTYYVYKVKYEVYGKEYETEKFEAANDSYRSGDIVEIRYDERKPETVVRNQIPIVWLVTIIFVVAIAEQIVKK